MYYFNIFFIFSILGHFIENLFYTSKDSGILFGYWTPIYGLGVCITIYIYEYINKKIKLTNYKKFIVSFLTGFIVLTILEYIGGFLIERFLRITFWDYSNEKLSIGRYTSLKMALIWGISSIVIIYLIKPIVHNKINKIPKIITYILITLFMIDCIISLTPFLIK